MRRALALLVLSVLSLTAQSSAPAPVGDYYCPMDRDVRSDKPGVCPRCGMKLVTGVPDDNEYSMDLTVRPAPQAGERVQLRFQIVDSKNGKTVDHFEIVHEKPFHLFIVSQDLQYFVHAHPEPQPGGAFLLDEKFPKGGLYRVLGDFYPSGGTPQLSAQTLIVPGPNGQAPALVKANPVADPGPSQGENTEVELVTDPPRPLAGFKTMLFLRLRQADGLEKYLAAWAHMLAASDDLIDMIHDHPFLADGGPEMQFNIIFPRAHTYKLWFQFQRKGVINTVSFTVPVEELK